MDAAVVQKSQAVVTLASQQRGRLVGIHKAAEQVRHLAVAVPGVVVLQAPRVVLEQQRRGAGVLDLVVDRPSLARLRQQRRRHPVLLAVKHDTGTRLEEVGGWPEQPRVLHRLRLAATRHDDEFGTSTNARLHRTSGEQRETAVGVLEQMPARAEQRPVEIYVHRLEHGARVVGHAAQRLTTRGLADWPLCLAPTGVSFRKIHGRTTMTATLGQRLERRDAQRFVGRQDEISRLSLLLEDLDAPASVVLVHGPSGNGKSTLLREAGRRASALGRPVYTVEGRDLAPVPGEIDLALRGVHDAQRPVVLLDTYERIAATGAHLRKRVLPALPDGTLVVIAGRRGPDPEWFENGWEAITTSIELGPLPSRDAMTLVERAASWTRPPRARSSAGRAGPPWRWSSAWTPPAERATARAWSSPCSTVARTSRVRWFSARRPRARCGEPGRPGRGRHRARLHPRPARDDAARHRRPPRRRWLQETSLRRAAERRHRAARPAASRIRAELRSAAPDRERELRGLIAGHVHGRASTDGLQVITDLAELMDAEALRWGLVRRVR